jgi:hypothetical protein
MSINAARFQFVADALTGGGGFLPVVGTDSTGQPISVSSSYLIQYPRESVAKFARRNEVAWYENHLLPACQRFVGYITKKPPIRDLPGPLLESFAIDCNWRGENIDVFWQGFMLQAKARGCMLLLVDMPRTLPDSQADQVEQRAFPYLVPITPERVTKYEVNERGRLSFLEYSDSLDGMIVTRGWDAKSWWVRQGDKQLDGDVHPLGVCPVLAFSESGEFPFFGPFTQIADLSKRLFNARSELDEILRSQTFSLLTYNVPAEQSHTFDAKTTAEAIGTHNMLVHHGSTPAFIAPSEGPANTYLEAIAHIERTIARVALAVELPEQQSASSGLALQIRFETLNSALTGFARRMEDLERSVWQLVSRWLNLSAVGSCEWAKDYALADLAAEMQVLADMIASGMPSEVIAQQKKTIVQLAFPALPQDEMAALLLAIEEPAQEIQTGLDAGLGELQASAAPDLSAITERLSAIETAITDRPPERAPIFNFAPPNITIEGATINVPEQPAPMVNIAPAAITVEAPTINVATPEVTPPAAPNVTLNTGTGGKVISLVKDKSGAITGATVKESGL